MVRCCTLTNEGGRFNYFKYFIELTSVFVFAFLKSTIEMCVLYQELGFKIEYWRGLFVSSVNCWISETEQVNFGIPRFCINTFEVWKTTFWDQCLGLKMMKDGEKKNDDTRKHSGSNFKWVDEQRENQSFCMSKASGLWFLAGEDFICIPAFVSINLPLRFPNSSMVGT